MRLGSLRRLSGLLPLVVLLWAAPSWGRDAEASASSATEGAAAERNTRSLDVLMAQFAASGGVRARFVETRHLSILMDPIETSGMLYFDPPDRLARHTTRPGRARVVVSGDRVGMRDESGEQRLDLSTSEVARDLVGNFIVMLSGDLEALESRFEVEYVAPADEPWVIELQPRSGAMRSIVERIRFKGVGAALAETEILETSGDTIITRLSEVETGVEFDLDERRRIFSLEGASDGR